MNKDNGRGISQRAYARRLGISHRAVQKAIKAGRISANGFGRIDPIRADMDWLFYANMSRSEVPDRAWKIMRDTYEKHKNEMIPNASANKSLPDEECDDETEEYDGDDYPDDDWN